MCHNNKPSQLKYAIVKRLNSDNPELKIKSTKLLEELSLIKDKHYLFNKIDFRTYNQNVIFTCLHHGDFSETPRNFLYKNKRCPTCYNNLNKNILYLNFVNKGYELYGDIYCYGLANYINGEIPILIKCRRCHNKFLMKPSDHLQGKGCTSCNKPGAVSETMLLHKIKKEFNDYKTISQGKPKWLGNQSLDIYFINQNIAIEYQGKQHFKPIKKWKGEDGLIIQLERDERKYNLCLQNDCKLFYFTYDKKDVPKDWHHKVYTKEEDLINEIKKILI